MNTPPARTLNGSDCTAGHRAPLPDARPQHGFRHQRGVFTRWRDACCSGDFVVVRDGLRHSESVGLQGPSDTCAAERGFQALIAGIDVVGSGLGQPVAVFLLGNDGVEPEL
jgi:hypothetical protein